MTRRSSLPIRRLRYKCLHNSFSVLYIFDVDEKAAKTVKNDDVTAAIQKVLAVESELMVYDSIAKELDRQYSETLQRQF
jgi:hypothetical protein